MNTRPALESSTVLSASSVSFNQDATCFTVGLDTGFCIFDCDPCSLRLSRDFNAGIGVAQMLGRANYLALLGGGRQPKFPQNKVIIWDDSKQIVATQISVLTTVLGVRLTRTHIVVALRNSIRVYKFGIPSDIWAVYETADNPLGLCCLTASTLIFPGRTAGQVQVVDLSKKGQISIIPAHASALRAIDISRDGEVLATASETGTLVRVFATSSCARIAELRRGVDHATIYSISIAPSGQQLAVTSDKSTLHLFDIPHPSKPARPASVNGSQQTSRGESPSPADFDASQKWGILGKIPLLPRVFSDVYSFASAPFHIGDDSIPGISAETRPPQGVVGWTSDESMVVIGAGADGWWEKFVVTDGEDGKRQCRRAGWKRYLGALD